MTNKVLRLPSVKKRTGLSRSTIYLLMKGGHFPASVKLGTRAVGWFEDDISNWLEHRRVNVMTFPTVEAR